MNAWLLMVVIVNLAGVSDVKIVPMTELQCRLSINVLKPVKDRVGAVCIGPEGQFFEAK